MRSPLALVFLIVVGCGTSAPENSSTGGSPGAGASRAPAEARWAQVEPMRERPAAR